MIRIALRSHLWTTAAWAGFFVLYAIIETASFTRISGGSARDQAQLGAGLGGVARSTTYLLPLPEHLETLGGYLAWFLFGFMPVFFALWGLMSGTAAARGAEERGLIEAWLAQGMRRRRYVVTRVAVFGVPAAAAVVLPAVTAGLIARSTGAHLSSVGMALEVIPLTLLTLVWFAAGMLSGQLFSTRRNALGASIAVALALMLLNGFSRTVGWLAPYRWVSPFAYLDRSNPVVAGGHLDVAATATIAVFAVTLTGLSAWAFSRRDIGAVIGRRPGARRGPRHPAANPLSRNPLMVTIWDQRVGLAMWSAGLFLYALMNLSLARSFVSFFASQPGGTLGLQARVAFGLGKGPDPVIEFIGGEWYPVLCLLLAAFALTQVSRWAAEDTDGRLEMILSAPVPRRAVVIRRGWSLIIQSLLLIGVAHVAVALSSHAQGFVVDGWKLGLASLLVLPIGVAFGALGAAAAAARPRAALALMTAILVVSYVVLFLAVPVFAPSAPPDWFVNLSVFKLYGNPLVEGVNWPGLAALLGLGGGGFAVAILAMRQRDVGT